MHHTVPSLYPIHVAPLFDLPHNSLVTHFYHTHTHTHTQTYPSYRRHHHTS